MWMLDMNIVSITQNALTFINGMHDNHKLNLRLKKILFLTLIIKHKQFEERNMYKESPISGLSLNRGTASLRI